MLFEDTRLNALLEKYPSRELEASLEEITSDYMEGKSELDILEGEVDYILEAFDSKGFTLHEELVSAKAVMKETKDGRMPCIIQPDWSIKPRYSEREISYAKELVEERGRLKRLSTALRRLRNEQ